MKIRREANKKNVLVLSKKDIQEIKNYIFKKASIEDNTATVMSMVQNLADMMTQYQCVEAATKITQAFDLIQSTIGTCGRK